MEDSGLKNHTLINLGEVAAIRTSPAKLYRSLGQIIRSKIQSGEWPVGEQIPSERMLMQAFGVSRSTVRQAIENLVKEGILYRVHGKGTFTAPQKIKQGVLSLLEFSNTMRRNGLNPSARLLGKMLYDPPPDIRQSLGLLETDKAFWFQRLLSVNDLPILIENTYYSATRFPDLLEIYDGVEETPIFISKHYGVKVNRESEVFEPVILESYEANLLGVKQGFPALWVEYVVYDFSGVPVVFGTTLLRGDRCRFYVDLTSV
jgi:GntR family transcriptional regulator